MTIGRMHIGNCSFQIGASESGSSGNNHDNEFMIKSTLDGYCDQDANPYIFSPITDERDDTIYCQGMKVVSGEIDDVHYSDLQFDTWYPIGTIIWFDDAMFGQLPSLTNSSFYMCDKDGTGITNYSSDTAYGTENTFQINQAGEFYLLGL